MDGIAPTVVFFLQLFPILLICASMGAAVAYRDHPNRGSNVLATLITVWSCVFVSWFVFMPEDASWMTYGAVTLLSLAIYTAVFIAGAKAGEQWKQPQAPDLGSINREWA